MRYVADEQHESDADRREGAALVIQAGVRRWLVSRQQSPVWSSIITQPRIISEERARHLRYHQWIM